MIKTTLSFIKRYPLKSHIKAFFIGLMISLFIMFPLIAATINILLIYISYLYPILIAMNFLIAVWFFLWVYFYLDALKSVHSIETAEFKKILLTIGLSKSVLWFLLGALLILIITPKIL